MAWDLKQPTRGIKLPLGYTPQTRISLVQISNRLPFLGAVSSMPDFCWSLSLRSRWILATLGATVCFLLAGDPVSAETSPPIVPGFERFFRSANADASRGGRLLLQELNCQACHAGAKDGAVQRQAPILDGVTSRVKKSYLKKYLRDPHAVKPGTPMPDVLNALPENQRVEAAEALVHFLASTGSPRQERVDKKLVNSGFDLYQKVGCVACHGTRDKKAKPGLVLANHVSLGDLVAKYTIPSLTAFLENPHQVRPSGRMPGLLNGKEAKEIANFLLQDAVVDLNFGPGSINFAYYEGTWDKLPDFSKLKPLKTGIVGTFNLEAGTRTNDMALKFTGFLKLDQPGDFHFDLASDDGSKLFIDGQLIVDNDGIHPNQKRTGKAKLKKGMHEVVVTFFNAGGEWELTCEIDGPSIGRQPLASLLVSSPDAKPKSQVVKNDEENFPIDPELAKKGHQLFSTMGCANCHSLAAVKKSQLKAPPLANLKGETGCLAGTAKAGVPWFGLDAAQKNAITAAMKAAPTTAKLSPAESVSHGLLSLNCYACHARDKIGGVQEEVNKSFQTNQPEMGDEARIPPPLDGVGGKIRPAYLKGIFEKGSRDRPYMYTRMPKFGTANAGHLVDAFVTLDQLPAGPEIVFTNSNTQVKHEARNMVGPKVFSCTKCHTFAGYKAEGVQGIDMTVMTDRLTREWFHAYLLDPQKVRPGTRMPASWPNGQTFFDKVLDGKTATQIEAIWVYLSQGKQARLPEGVKKQAIPLVAADSAILYRNFIEGAGPRAIGVGYPEKANLAFDANEMRLAMVWHGAFIDAARHWTDRGVGYEPPAGDGVIHLPPGPAFAKLASESEAWPSKSAKQLGYQFKGYRLATDDRPTFLYRIGDIDVEDQPNAKVGKDVSILTRTVTLKGQAGAGPLYFRALVAKKIEAKGEGVFRINDEWQMRIEQADARIRSVGGSMELIIPILFKDGRASFREEFLMQP